MAPDRQIRLDVRLERDTVWLTQTQLAKLFDRERSVVTKHIGNAFKEGTSKKAMCKICTLQDQTSPSGSLTKN